MLEGMKEAQAMCVDEQHIIQLKELMGDDFKLLIDTFIKDSALKIDAMQSALRAGDSELLRTSAHGLKGSALNLSANKLTDICMKIENMGKAGELEGAKVLIEQVEKEYRSVTGSLLTL